MCARMKLTPLVFPEFRPEYIELDRKAPVMLGDGVFRAMTWGWPIANKPLYWARAETVFERQPFQYAARHQRGVVLIDGWFERNHYITCPTRSAAAVIWIPDHFVLLTTEAPQSIRSVHHRMPALVDAEEWLKARLRRGQTCAVPVRVQNCTVS